MQHLPGPVVIITASESEHPQPGAACGMTVSSFTTVSLDPIPIISFNVKRPSTTLDAIFKSSSSGGSFFVNIPATSAVGASLARAFTRGNALDNMQTAAALGVNLSSSGPPRFEQSEIVPVGLECKLLHNHSIDVADHCIVVAKVCDATFWKTSETVAGEVEVSAPFHGLCYGKHAFRQWESEVRAEES